MKLRLIFYFFLPEALMLLTDACFHSSNIANNSPASNSSNVSSDSSSKVSTIRICTFNIQNLGLSKLSKEEVTSELVSIIRKYDIIAVQEISDIHNTAGTKFLDLINQNQTTKYAMKLSDRSGQQPDDKSDQEQYAFYYNTTTITNLGQSRLYNDSLHDYFVREPFLARFKVIHGNFSFVLCTVHTKPEAAVEEIKSLDETVKWAKSIYKDEEDYIVLGDFNASCSYAKPEQLDNLEIRKSYQWLIADTVKTNLSSKHCAYDRILITQTTKPDYTGNWGVDRCFVSKSISDHWPVWAEFYTNKDSN